MKVAHRKRTVQIVVNFH
uniref:Uncharacterized protein n=1 Tax=Bursaphelenchus xylophilus TaxID=6326 RepID=A0A1I7SNJ3_BURXY